MFERSAAYYDAIYSWKDYDGEVARLLEILADHGIVGGSLLDVACGTGAHLARLERSFQVEGVELAPSMAAVARGRLPETPIHEADMRTFDLGRSFDVVTCLFSSIGYMTEPEDLHAAIGTMARHLSSAGILVMEPWFRPDQFFEGHVGGDFFDGPDMKIARMAKSWTEGPISVMEMHHLVGTPGNVDSYVETHRLGLYTDAEYREAFTANGLRVEFDEAGLMGRGLYLGTRA